MIPLLAEQQVLELELQYQQTSNVVSLAVQEAQLRKIESLNMQLRLSSLRAAERAKEILTAEQRNILLNAGGSLPVVTFDQAASMEQKIEAALDSRVMDRRVVELETVQAIEGRLLDRAKTLAWLVGIPLAIGGATLAFLGITTYRDFTKFVRNAKKELEERHADANKNFKAFEDDIMKSQKRFEKTRGELGAQVKEAALLLSTIKEKGTAVDRIFRDATIQAMSLTATQELELEELKEEQPEKFRATGEDRGERLALHGKLWPVGAMLRVRFLGGTAEQHALVKKFASEWTNYANIKFEFGSPALDAEVRVSFVQDMGSWAYLGTDGLVPSSDQATLNIGGPVDQPTVLKTFGSVLGLIWEHLNPNAQIPWDKEAVYRDLTSPPNNWDITLVNQNIFTKHDLSSYRDFDPKSVMMIPIPAAWTGGRIEVGRNEVLSKGDKEFIAKLYPFEGR
jgi:hypothetical protein